MRVVRRGLGWALGLILAVGLGASPFAASAQSPPPSTGEPAADGGGPIPLAEVAARAAEIHSLLETQDTAISPSREIQAILDRLPKLTDELRVRLDETVARLEANPPLPVLEQIGAGWDTTRARLRSWNDTVTQWTTRIEQERGRLASLRESWLRSREAAAASGAPKVVLDQIDGVVSQLNAARTRWRHASPRCSPPSTGSRCCSGGATRGSRGSRRCGPTTFGVSASATARRSGARSCGRGR